MLLPLLLACALPPSPPPTTWIPEVSPHLIPELDPESAPPPPPPRPPPYRPPPLTSAPDHLFQCGPGDTCVISCDLPGAWCGAPCGCRTAVNARVLGELRRLPWAPRPADYDCPAMGCAYDPAMAASCVDGRCKPW